METEYNAGDKNHTTEEASLNNVAQECPTSSQEDGNVCRPLVSKSCLTCKRVLDLSNFYFNRTRDKYFTECKVCNISRSRKWNKSNASKYKDNCIRHRELNPDLYSAYKKKEYLKNKSKYAEYGEKYRKSKHGKRVRSFLERKRKLRKLQSCPKWLTQSQIEDIRKIYENRPDGYHVDHIVPLNGEEVCGLHVSWNLQYLPAVENIKKRNKLL